MADGYHTPLTKTQIAELFHAGRLRRNHPCKQVEKKEWRTLDELFPLLKYQSSARTMSEEHTLGALPPRARILILSLSLVAVAMLALLAYFFTVGAGENFKNAGLPPTKRAMQVSSGQTIYAPLSGVNVVPSSSKLLPPHSSKSNIVPAYSNEAIEPSVDLQQARFAQERWNVEQRERERTQAAKLAQDRANAEQREREQQKAAGRTERVPLDEYVVVPNVGGSDVTVKIHDHDITTIDVWTAYTGAVQLTKQKGITGSRTMKP